MSQFTQEQQTEIIKHARDLTATIEAEEKQVKKLEGQRYKNAPVKPLHAFVVNEKKFTPAYPAKPKANYKFIDHIKYLLKIKDNTNKTLLIVLVIFLSIFASGILLLGLIYSAYTYFLRKKEINESLLKTPEYLQAISDAEKDAREQQALYDKQLEEEQRELDIKFEKESEEYNTILLPKYNEEKAIWQENQERKIAILNEEIRLNKEVLTSLYDETKLVSVTYRPLWILCWLYDDMSSSDHDIRYATELLDRDRQRLATEEAGQIVSRSVGKLENSMLQGMNAIYNAIDYGNALQEETIDELSKTRRDMNIGNIIGTIQRHNTNKMLKELVPKKKK